MFVVRDFRIEKLRHFSVTRRGTPAQCGCSGKLDRKSCKKPRVVPGLDVLIGLRNTRDSLLPLRTFPSTESSSTPRGEDTGCRATDVPDVASNRVRSYREPLRSVYLEFRVTSSVGRVFGRFPPFEKEKKKGKKVTRPLTVTPRSVIFFRLSFRARSARFQRSGRIDRSFIRLFAN